MNEDKLCRPDCPGKKSGHCYSNHGCRCDRCKRFHSRRMIRRRVERDPSTLPPEAHGKRATYINWKCRCGKCSLAQSEYNAHYQARKRP